MNKTFLYPNTSPNNGGAVLPYWDYGTIFLQIKKSLFMRMSHKEKATSYKYTSLSTCASARAITLL
jgi:hypothetical protein